MNLQQGKDKYLIQINNAINHAIKTGSFDKRNLIENARNVCVFGLGTYFNEAFEQHRVKEKFNVNLLCDNDPAKWDKEFYGLKCVSPDELKKCDDVIVITMLGDPRKVNKQLDQMGISHMTHTDLALDSTNNLSRDQNYFLQQTDRIIEAYSLLEEEESRRLFANLLCLRIAPQLSEYSYDALFSNGEYYGHNLFALNDTESFVDCGAYNGDTIMKFLEKVQFKFNKIYAFELDQANFTELQKFVKSLDPLIANKIECFNAGVWHQDAEITYGKGVKNEPAEGISIFKHDNFLLGKVVQLDTALSEKQITFLKMDIEGAEQNALKGAKNIIKTQQPKLAICLYHRLEDLWEIPIFLKALVPNYKITIRHHFLYNVWGTVCYASI